MSETRPAKKRRLDRSAGPTNGTKVVNFQDDHDHQPASDASFNAPRPRLKQRALELSTVRQKLPIWSHADEIRRKVRENDVLLLVGETGSGKSTQIPQFLLEDGDICRRRGLKNGGGKVGGSIGITQPRRVAAISLARRVAEEMGSPLGSSSPAAVVGYSVRFDSSVGPSTRVKFLTDGMLLQELLRDPWLKEYSVVVVDEVHERGVNVDLVLGFLKRMIEGRNEGDGRGGVPLKVVVMSATADMERIQAFFGSGVKAGDDATTDGTGEDKSQSKDEWNGLDGEDDSRSVEDATTITAKTTSCYIKGRQFPVTIHYSPQPVPNALDAAMERIIHIHTHTPLPGDVLVFLPGQETIDSLESMCNNYAHTLTIQSKQKGAPRVPKLLILPLFAALPTAMQQRVFERTPPFTRKIILSTNIAETSVTVPGIRHVIDSGKRKARFFRPSLNLETLLSKPISRSSANQRSGRAGREAPGHCYRLYTEKTFYELVADTEPEILRCDLSQLVLTLKAHKIENPLAFPLLTPLPLKSLERALLHLLRLRALDRRTSAITKLGHRMSSLPLPANLACILLASKLPQFNCLNEIIDIVSGLSVENIWLPIHNQSKPVTSTATPISFQTNGTKKEHDEDSDDESKSPIAQARSTLYRREGDHLTLLAAIQAYVSESTDRKEWCRRHGISHRAMSAAMDVRKQLTKLFSVKDRKDKKPTDSTSTSTPTSTPASQPQTPNPPPPPSNPDLQALQTRILHCLHKGLSENTAYLSPSSSSQTQNQTSTIWSGPYKTHTSQPRNLQIHPSSVLFTRTTRPAVIMFQEFVVTGRAYGRVVSEIRGEWVDEIDVEDGDGEENGV